MTSLADFTAPSTSLHEIEPGLYSVFPEEDQGARYDARARGYDWLMSSRAYSRLAWGLWPKGHTAFVKQALTNTNQGIVVDIAAGSCVASAPAYATTKRQVVILDRSLAMLRQGMKRIRRLHGDIPPHLAFLQADTGDLPFRDKSIATVLCHGAFHLFQTPRSICSEWMRVLIPNGELYVSSLVRGRWLGDRYLGLLHRAGEIAQPRTVEEVTQILETETDFGASIKTRGNFAYLTLTPTN